MFLCALSKKLTCLTSGGSGKIMFEIISSEIDIKEKLSKIKEIDQSIYECLLGKIEFDKIKRLKKTARQIARRYLTRPIREYQSRLTIKQLINKVNRNTGKKKILFLVGHPTFDFLGMSVYLRKTGQYETILLMENPLLIDVMERYFDAVYVYNSFYDVAFIIGNVTPYVIHTQGAINYYFFAIIAKLLSSSKVVIGLYDIPTFGFSKEDYNRIWCKTDTMLDAFVAEEFAFKGSDGVLVTIHSLEAGQILKERCRSDVPMMEFHSYPCEEFIGDGEKFSDLDGGIHIVYGGIVISPNRPRRLYGDVQFMKLIDKLTGQGIYFDIYPSPHFRSSSTRRRSSDYIKLSEESPFFNFRQAVLPDMAPREFAKYDFASMMYLLDGVEFDREHYRMTIPSKFFKYMEAGLPVIVTEELQYVSRLVKEYEIGIVVSQKEIDNLSEIIKSYDYDKLRANVKEAQKQFSMERHIGRLIDFYNRVSEKKPPFEAIEKASAIKSLCR